jgi:UDP-N-acetyl-D-galactosamine dehydrogenase
MIAKLLKKGDVIIYESTVYPGCTEEDCVPILEQISGLKYNIDFFCGYSPERINPGDKVNTLTKIKKVTSGSNSDTAIFVDNLYQSVITAGTFMASSIKVAEASKAIENAQRDVNISFVNELALIFDRMNIDTNEVLDAASTKWNFLRFNPGLVGGHCIGVDPYYLAHKAESLGYHPQVILSGRRVNDNMGMFVANKVVKLMIQKGIVIKNSNVLLLGVTFKENCNDLRGSKVLDIIRALRKAKVKLQVYDPIVSIKDFNKYYPGLKIKKIHNKLDALIVAVSHKEFLKLNYTKIKNMLKNENSIVMDVKSIFNDKRIKNKFDYWSL